MDLLMKSKFFPSVVNFFTNKEKVYVASKINLITFVIAILCIPLYFLNPEYTNRWLFIHSAAIVSISLSTYFLKGKQVFYSAWASTSVFWITVTYLVLTSGGVFSVLAFFYIFPILFAYLLLHSQVGLGTLLVSLIALIYMYFDPFELVSQSFKPKKIDWIFTTSLFLISGHFIILAIFSVIRINLYKLRKENVRKRLAERRLKNLNQNLNNILESIVSVGVILTNPRGEIRSFNTGAQNILGYNQEEVVGIANIISLLDDEELKYLHSNGNEDIALFKTLCASIKENSPPREEWTFIRKDKSKAKFRLTVVPLYSSNSQIEAYLFTAVDMTEVFETQTIIEILNKDLEEKVEQRTKELQRANESLIEMNLEMQKTLSELAKTQKSLIHSEKMAALGQLSASIGHELNTPIGAVISASYTQRDFMENSCIAILERVYELSEEKFTRFISLLEKCKESFSKSGHLTRVEKKEIRERLKNNPFLKPEDLELIYEINLNYADLNVQELLWNEDISSILEILYFFCQMKKTNQIIELAAEKANNVLKSLRLYLSSPTSSKLEAVYLSKEIEMILTLHQNKLKQGIEVIKDFQAKEPFLGNKGGLNQVWINLINNAIDAMNGKGVLKIRSEIQDGFLFVSFQDNGKGIPQEIQHKIFEPFFTTKKEGDGIGLGLHLCKKIIDKMNGSITFQSELGNTTFTVRLPYIEVLS